MTDVERAQPGKGDYFQFSSMEFYEPSWKGLPGIGSWHVKPSVEHSLTTLMDSPDTQTHRLHLITLLQPSRQKECGLLS